MDKDVPIERGAIAKPVTGFVSKFVEIHFWVGPPAGMLAIPLAAIAFQIHAFIIGSEPIASLLDTIVVVFWAMIGFIALSYLFGLVPALLHAGAMLWLSRALSNRSLWLAIVPFSGFLCAAGPCLLISYAFKMHDFWLLVASAGVCGTVSALVCMYVAWRSGQLPPMKGEISMIASTAD